jgi:hypothetical protein
MRTRNKRIEKIKIKSVLKKYASLIRLEQKDFNNYSPHKKYESNQKKA